MSFYWLVNSEMMIISTFVEFLQNTYVRVDKLMRCSLASYAVMRVIDGFVRLLPFYVFFFSM